MPFYGEERLQWMFAQRSFWDYGVVATGATDYPPGPFEPLLGIQSCVTRTDSSGKVWGPNQKVSVDEALKIYTINGAYASFEENLKGSIEVGKLADLVVLGGRPDPSRRHGHQGHTGGADHRGRRNGFRRVASLRIINFLPQSAPRPQRFLRELNLYLCALRVLCGEKNWFSLIELRRATCDSKVRSL